MYTLVWTPHFTRSAERFSRLHPELRAKLVTVVRDLERDPFRPHLRYHQLAGELEGVAAVSLTHSYRITLTVIITAQEIVLLGIGSHDEGYR